jgi:hypothetical protein
MFATIGHARRRRPDDPDFRRTPKTKNLTTNNMNEQLFEQYLRNEKENGKLLAFGREGITLTHDVHYNQWSTKYGWHPVSRSVDIIANFWAVDHSPGIIAHVILATGEKTFACEVAASFWHSKTQGAVRIKIWRWNPSQRAFDELTPDLS